MLSSDVFDTNDSVTRFYSYYLFCVYEEVTNLLIKIFQVLLINTYYILRGVLSILNKVNKNK